jgi:uncharacterized caspase-like protein
MDTAVLERRVSNKTWNRTRGFEKLKPQVKADNAETSLNESWDDYELSDEFRAEIEEALEDIRQGKTIRLHTPKNFKECIN